MSFNFDEIIDRRNTNCMKYDFAVERGKPADILPLWVADMDFRTPPCVVDALRQSSEHGIFGYTSVKSDYAAIMQRWFGSRFGWSIEPDWLVRTPGVVYAVATAIRSLTQPGDAILIQQPVYYPFRRMISINGRRVVNSPLVCQDNRYSIDFADFEDKIRQENVRMFILCSPHNPVGRVWTRAELERMGDICAEHGVIIVSDEIHADFMYPGYHQTILADIKPAFRAITVTCTAPSKTFNLAGLQIANVVIANAEQRRLFRQEMDQQGYGQVNTMGLVACQAAYRDGDGWLDELLVYLAGNLALLRRVVQDEMPGIRLIEPEGTYLAWLDCRGLDLTAQELDERIVHQARVWLDDGRMFGDEGAGFQRINIACPRSTLARALTQLRDALRPF
jgi:cystathionine beta-lyase